MAQVPEVRETVHKPRQRRLVNQMTDSPSGRSDTQPEDVIDIHMHLFNRDFRFACPRWPFIRDFHFARRIRALIHQHASPHARFLHRTLRRSLLKLDVEPTRAPTFRAFLRHRSTLGPFLRHAGFVVLSPRVSLPAPAAPRSSATCRRTAVGSDALPPAGASSTWHASPAGLRFSPAAAGDS